MLSAFRIKVVVVGDYGVSKTSMLKSVVTTSSRTDVNVQYGQYSDTEIELHVRSSLRREPVTMMIWDTCSKYLVYVINTFMNTCLAFLV
jgi:signal recognition particle receptor subunit beta